jgi:hypothetical protein
MRTTKAIAAALALTLPALSAGAAQRVSLQHVAAQAHYHYEWSDAGYAVVLSRPGTFIVLRVGAQLYQVNEHTEVADAAPSYSRGDLYVSPALARHLEALARRGSPLAAAAAGTTTAFDRPAHGAITLEARQLQGSESIEVEGTAPPGAPVTITLETQVSSDVPTILVSRHDVVTDVNGRFGAVIPTASAYERGMNLSVLATSTPGVASAHVLLTTTAPNGGAIVPLESAH